MEQQHNGTTNNSTTAQNNRATATAEKKHTDASAFTHEKRGTRHSQSSANFEVANLSQFLLVVEQCGPHARPRCEVIFMS